MKKLCFVTTVSMTMKAFVIPIAVYLHGHTDWDITLVCDEDPDFRKSLPPYLHYHAVPMARGIHLSGIKAMLEMEKFFREEHFDLVQYATPNASLYAAMAAKRARIPVRLYCQWGLAYVGFRGIKRWIFKQEEKYVCRLSTWIEPDSRSNLDFAHREGLYPPNQGSVVWNGSAVGVNLEKFDITKREPFRDEIRRKYHIPAEAFVFIFVGRITRDKGVNELFEAFSQFDDAWLMMVGWNEVDQTVNRELYQKAQSSSRVVFTGFTDEVEKYLSAADCYLLPSYREGFGMGVIEAEAMGLPVVVTDIPGPTDAMVEHETGIVVQKANSKELHRAMKRICENQEEAKRMGTKGAEFAAGMFEQKQLFAYILRDRKALLKQS